MDFGPKNLVRLPLRLFETAPRFGVDPDELLQASGLRRAEVEDPDSYVATSKVVKAWRFMLGRVADPALGIRVVQATRVRDLGLLGYSMAHSSNLRGALRRLVRYGRVLSNALDWSLDEDSRGARVVTKGIPILDGLKRPVDVRLAFVVHAAREITEADIVPREVCFPYSAPADAREHRRFFRCSLQFDCPEPAVVIGRNDLERPVPASDETLVGYLEQFAEQIARSMSEDGSMTHRTRRAIWHRLGEGRPARAQVAAELGVSARTLQRRLEREGTTFAAVLDALRREAAAELLRNPDLPVSEIAFLLGYSDTRNFYRGFRRWEGRTPSDYRRSS